MALYQDCTTSLWAQKHGFRSAVSYKRSALGILPISIDRICGCGPRRAAPIAPAGRCTTRAESRIQIEPCILRRCTRDRAPSPGPPSPVANILHHNQPPQSAQDVRKHLLTDRCRLSRCWKTMRTDSSKARCRRPSTVRISFSEI
jgi:hypothetical protein